MTTDPDNDGLPIEVVDRDASTAAHSPWWRLAALPVLAMFVFSGGVAGMYFQPPGLKWFMRTTGLEPGGGTSDPIALPLDTKSTSPESTPKTSTVAGIGRLIPRGDVMALAPPFGAGDARIAEIRVIEGQRVAANEILVVLDNESTLRETVAAAKANLGVRQASLSQSKASTKASRQEAQAALERAQAAASQARIEYDRGKKLLASTAVSQSSVDKLESDSTQADREVTRLKAALSRFSAAPNSQVDVVVSQRTLDAASVDLQKAESELERAYIRAPLDATVLTISGRPGERPGAEGVLEVGDLEQMVAEVEVYQSQISQVAVGQTVNLSADALEQPLVGTVRSVGLSVGRQTLVGSDPAANTDARVLKVYVDLDADSTQRASRFTNLQVLAQFEVGD